jgi:hypothetical protein
VTVLFCGSCRGYPGRAAALAARLGPLVKGGAIADGSGPAGAFEVSLSRPGHAPRLLWSKLATGEPATDDAAAALAPILAADLRALQQRRE